MNIDYAITNALKTQKGLDKAFVIYDIGCQWSVNFLARVKGSPGLVLPENMEVIPAIGKFHLAAHKPTCFPRFSLNFIRGASYVDGEAMEPLWTEFNRTSKFARSMSQSHRREIYDAHMRDSNWKKITGISKSSLFQTNMHLDIYF